MSADTSDPALAAAAAALHDPDDPATWCVRVCLSARVLDVDAQGATGMETGVETARRASTSSGLRKDEYEEEGRRGRAGWRG